MKVDNTISTIGKIKNKANDLIIRELRLNGHSGFAPSHGDILVRLFRQGDQTMTDLAIGIDKERSTVTTLVEKLKKLGYVTTRKNEEDSRSTYVSLTDRGRELEPLFFQISVKIYDIQYKGMSEEEISMIRNLLSRMYTNFK